MPGPRKPRADTAEGGSAPSAPLLEAQGTMRGGTRTETLSDCLIVEAQDGETGKSPLNQSFGKWGSVVWMGVAGNKGILNPERQGTVRSHRQRLPFITRKKSEGLDDHVAC